MSEYENKDMCGDEAESISSAVIKLANSFNDEFEEEDISKRDFFGNMKSAMINILDLLCFNSGDFDIGEFINLVNNYISNYERILYSTITDYIFVLETKKEFFKIDNLTNNIELVLDEILNSTDADYSDINVKIFIKLWDHIHLANEQLAKLGKMKDMIVREYKSELEPTLDKTLEVLGKTNDNYSIIDDKLRKLSKKSVTIQKDLNNSKKDLYSQLISIVSIFTAISFVMFGGMTLLNDLFDYRDMPSIPLVEMICGGSLIGIVTISILYLFVVLILFITNKLNKGDRWPYIGPFVYSVSILVIIFTVTFSKWMGIL